MQIDGRRIGIAADAQAMIGAGNHQIIGVEAKRQIAFADHAIDRDKGGVFDLDSEFFKRGDQPMLAVVIAGHQSGKGAHHGRAADQSTLVIPRSIRGNAHIAVAGFLRAPLLHRGQFALRNLLGNLGKGQFGEIGRGIVRLAGVKMGKQSCEINA